MENKKELPPIRIEKTNSSFFQLIKISSTDIAKISEKFSWLPQSYKYNPKFRLMGVKGVKVRMVQVDGSFPAGLFKEVYAYIVNVLEKKVILSTAVQEHMLPLNDLFEEGINDSIFSDFEFDGNQVILRDYQCDGVEKAFSVRNGLLNLSTGAGKCLGPNTKLKIRIDTELFEKYKHLFEGDGDV